jgi:hypothetical protein
MLKYNWIGENVRKNINNNGTLCTYDTPDTVLSTVEKSLYLIPNNLMRYLLNRQLKVTDVINDRAHVSRNSYSFPFCCSAFNILNVSET